MAIVVVVVVEEVSSGVVVVVVGSCVAVVVSSGVEVNNVFSIVVSKTVAVVSGPLVLEIT